MAGIFISYRRADSQGFSGRLSDDLSDVFGNERVFRDIEIPVGSDFSKVLHHAIDRSDILLVVMGPNWATPEGYGSRLFEPDDWVRKEIESAFELNKAVIPILVGDTRMPAAGTLPPSIQRLVKLQAATLSDRHWDKDIAELATRLKQLSPALGKSLPRKQKKRNTADVIDQLGGKLIDGLLDQVRNRNAGQRRSRSVIFRGVFPALRYLSKLITAITLLVVVYFGIHFFADAATIAQLNKVESLVLSRLGELLTLVTR